MTTTSTAGPPVTGVLARQEIRNYLRHKLFWAGTALLAVFTVLSLAAPTVVDGTGDTASTALDVIVPGALVGVFGLIVTAGLTRRSDRAAEAAGTVAVPERTRTLALAASVVVPASVALLWFVAAVIGYEARPPAAATVPIGAFGDGDVITVMFALSVLAAVGGPVLGLVIARWLPRRGVTPIAVVLLVLGTILLQGNWESTWRWHVVWPWTYWYGPLGWNTGTDHWIALPGSPQAWLLYVLALCVLGVLVAVYHDPEADRTVLRRVIAATVVIAVAALVLTMTTGLPDAVHNPLVVRPG